MFCGKCGNQVEPDALFCNVCGERIAKSENVEKIQQINNNSENEFGTNTSFNVNPNSSQKNNKKATKTGLIIFISVAAFVVIAGIILGIVFISKKIKNDKINKEIANEVMDATTELTDGVHDTFNDTSNQKSTTNSTTDSTTDSSTKKIGSSKYGYLKVKDNWQSYVDSEHPEVLEYDLDSNWAICMSVHPTSTISARAYADNVKELFKSNGVIPMDIKDKVGSYNAYRISGYYADYKRYLKVWCFETGDGNTHYISIEGPDNVSDKYDIINTFTLY